MQGEKHFLAVLLFKSVGFVLFFVVVVSIQNISRSFPHPPQIGILEAASFLSLASCQRAPLLNESKTKQNKKTKKKKGKKENRLGDFQVQKNGSLI